MEQRRDDDAKSSGGDPRVTRRSTIGVFGSGVVGGLAGCVDFAGGENPESENGTDSESENATGSEETPEDTENAEFDGPIEEGTYRITAVYNDDDIVWSVDGELESGSNIYNDRIGEADGQIWQVEHLYDDVYRIGVAGIDLYAKAEAARRHPGTNAIAYEWTGNDYHEIRVVPRNNAFMLEPRHAQLAFDIPDSDPEPGANLQYDIPVSDPNQLFKFQPVEE